jgi:hypothetical protein
MRDVNNKRLTVRVVTPLPAGGEFRNIIHQEQITAQRDTHKRLRLASIFIPRPHWQPRHSIWGPVLGEPDLLAGQVTIVGRSQNIVEIVIGFQTYRAFVQISDPSRKDSCYINVLNEEELPWM